MRVSYTPDGDTVRAWRSVTENGTSRMEQVRIRLAYLDAPEIGHAFSLPYALAARAYLRRLLVLGEPITVRILGRDVYGRLLGEVLRVRDDGNCGLRLVLGGYVALRECPLSQEAYFIAESIAKEKRLGIWRKSGPWQTPWLTRHVTDVLEG